MKIILFFPVFVIAGYSNFFARVRTNACESLARAGMIGFLRLGLPNFSKPMPRLFATAFTARQYKRGESPDY